ncbi:MAG TPA: hypothetical protein VFQ44_08335 [Streptosporangiaceae bacterium]|nr:hypothetical protein [Streptosporangiaceae bacterium]
MPGEFGDQAAVTAKHFQNVRSNDIRQLSRLGRGSGPPLPPLDPSLEKFCGRVGPDAADCCQDR